MKQSKHTGGQDLVETVIYLRLSNADGLSAESDSIQNQRAFLTGWAQRNRFLITREFVDDGHTGTDFDRPGFQELNRCLMDGSVRCILVKDLSRLGRNYTETGRYLEQIFPRLGVRFIAVNDQYDSAKNTDSIQQMAVFKNVFNDFYAADASTKVRTSLNILKRQGKFLARQAPYGYCIDPQDRYHLLPDEETACVVRRIFALFLGGTSRTGIAEILNRENIPSPAARKKLTDKSRQFTGLWNAEAVRRILSHPVYQGDMAQQFTRMVSYKVHERRRVAPDQWIVVPDTHQPIVSREDFALAQRMQSVRTYQTTDHPHLLTGIAYCADCGSPLYAKKRGGYWYLNCYGYYRDPTMHRCTSHSIREDVVVDAVLNALRRLAGASVNPEELTGRWEKAMPRKASGQSARHRLEQRLEQARRARLSLYKDKVSGLLREEEFSDLLAQLRREEELCRRQLAGFRSEDPQSTRQQILDRVRRFLRFEDLKKVQLQQLVRRVTVDSQKQIAITFAFADPGRKV